MKYGYFDDEQREYVIRAPETPSPWINYFGCEQFFSLFSQTGGGYSFYRDARLRRITRYRYNNIPADSNGRYFFIRDEADGDYWSIGYMPVKRPVDHFECRHGLGYSRITSRRKELTRFAIGICAARRQLRSAAGLGREPYVRARTLKLFSYVEFCLWNALDDMTNFQRNLSTGEVEVDGPTIYHVTEYRERRNHFAFFHVNHPLAGFDTDREAFVGVYSGLARTGRGRRRRSREIRLPAAGRQLRRIVWSWSCNRASGRNSRFFWATQRIRPMRNGSRRASSISSRRGG